MKIGFVSLGCPKNQLDTEVMLHEILQAGYEITPEEIEADVIIVNTCAFIESAKKEAIENILDVAWLKKHRSLRAIIVTGCLAERYGEEIFRELNYTVALEALDKKEAEEGKRYLANEVFLSDCECVKLKVGSEIGDSKVLFARVDEAKKLAEFQAERERMIAEAFAI